MDRALAMAVKGEVDDEKSLIVTCGKVKHRLLHWINSLGVSGAAAGTDSDLVKDAFLSCIAALSAAVVVPGKTLLVAASEVILMDRIKQFLSQ